METDGELQTDNCLICGAENKSCDHNKSGEKAVISMIGKNTMVHQGNNPVRPRMRMPRQRVPNGRMGYIGEGTTVDVYDKQNPNIRFAPEIPEVPEALKKAKERTKKKAANGEDNSN